ncbi:ATP-binding protein [Crocosphaera sp.]|uniref:ATP-binding protein n=1 Tax=Crocosphaera sp. TaxID=2729996 RepID=UPI00257C11CB|nr:ATP-binding protein [Crocosphaera sp.]NQZ63568.1 AAA family ATPase [Crocosphaera sp.]
MMNKKPLMEQDFAWLEACIEYRIQAFLNTEDNDTANVLNEPKAPSLDPEENNYYCQFIRQHTLSEQERLIVLIALAPEIKPQIFDDFLIKNTHTGNGFSEFGGYQLGSFSGFIPDMRTALFILAGDDLIEQVKLHPLFDRDTRLLSQNILIDHAGQDGPKTHQKLQPSETTLAMILSGKQAVDLGANFPAREINTPLRWSNLVLPASTELQLKELMAWLKMQNRWKQKAKSQNKIMAQDIYKGYRCLFYGPPGTGKSLTASLLGKKAGSKVYRVELSQLVSKYIGETEKNMEQVFKQAEANQWVLFFDEADALFNQRTEVSNSNDRSANQQVAYLLQRIEACTTTVILATNLKENIDPAFVRRFQSMVYFPMPERKQRAKLWRSLFGTGWRFDDKISFNELGQYDLAGGAMNNVIRYASLMAMQRDSDEIHYTDIIAGVQREYAKQHRSLPV